MKEVILSDSPIDFEKLCSNRILERVFHSAAARIMDFFILFRKYDYSEGEIKKKTGLSAKTVSKELDNLVNEEYIVVTRKSGKSTMYKLNEEYLEGLLAHYKNIIERAKEA